MSNDIKSFGPIGRALLQLVVGYHRGLGLDDETALDRVGSRFDYEPPMPWYVRIDSVFRKTNRLEGDFTFDVEVFAPADGDAAESVSDDLEALVLGYPHVVEVDGGKVIIDTVSQNSGPRELPWEDEAVTRLGATYVITARRR